MQRILMVGAGGTGGFLLDPLIRFLNKQGEYFLGVMDGDTVEAKNFERQPFTPSAINMNKAEAACRPYRYLNKVTPINEYLGADNIAEYITDGTTVLICADNTPVRALIEDHCLTLNSSIVINGGNEEHTGSTQVWIRKDGINITPPISFLHPEIREPGPDRSLLSCAQVAELPGGEQLIVANLASALYMLTALMQLNRGEIIATETQFALFPPKTYFEDYRDLPGWN